MNNRINLEEQFRNLAEYLKQGTNLAPQVMRDVQRIAAHSNVGRSAMPTIWQRLPRIARYPAALTVAAALLIVALLFVWRDRQSLAWAEVVKAVAEKPWLHAVTTLPDGKKSELWCSAGRSIIAVQNDEVRCWVDTEQHSRAYYDAKENTIVRLPDDKGRDSSALFEAIFKAFLSADVGRTLDVGRYQFVHQRERVVEENGKRWIEHSFILHDNKSQYESDWGAEEWIVYVDPDTRLPFRWEQLVHSREADKDVDASRRCSIRSEIDYPETGPADIYALGVPKNAKVVDYLAAPSQPDVDQLIAAVRSARWQADKYYALVVEGVVDQHWARGFPSHRIWRNGARWRAERSFGFNPSFADLPAEDVDSATWWKQKVEGLRFVPSEVCDAKWLWEYTTPTDKSRIPAFPPQTREGEYIRCADLHPEYFVRPLPYLFAPDYSPLTPNEVKLYAEPASGPPNAVLLEAHNSRWTPGRQYPQVWRYWINPEQDYLVIRYEELVMQEGKEEIVRGHAIEEVIQDPRGRWYPTVIRLFKRSVLVGSDNKPRDGIMRCYYDFAAPMPDSLFQPD